MATLAQAVKFIEKNLVPAGDCLLYPAAPGTRALLKVEGKAQNVHRIIYQFHFGSIPEGLFVLHSCDRGQCCNIAHLSLGTQRENVRQALDRKRMVSAGPLPGVSFDRKRKLWRVLPTVNGRQFFLYSGRDLFEACCRRKSFEASTEL